MIFIDRRTLTLNDEKELKELGFILSFKYSLGLNQNVFDIFVIDSVK